MDTPAWSEADRQERAERERASDTTMLRIITLNIQGYSDQFAPWTERKRAIVRALLVEQPDIVMLQAVQRREGTDQAAELAREADYPFVSVHSPLGCNHGLAYLSRIPLGRSSERLLSNSIGDQDPSERLICCAEFPAAKDLLVFNCHFSWIPAQNQRNIEEALKFVEGTGRKRIIVGDFNADPESPGIRIFLEHGWTDLWPRIHPDDLGYTFAPPRHDKRIDFVLSRPELCSVVSDMRLILDEPIDGVYGSDHAGLAVTLDV